jgi:hypothetical protein
MQIAKRGEKRARIPAAADGFPKIFPDCLDQVAALIAEHIDAGRVGWF